MSFIREFRPIPGLLEDEGMIYAPVRNSTPSLVRIANCIAATETLEEVKDAIIQDWLRQLPDCDSYEGIPVMKGALWSQLEISLIADGLLVATSPNFVATHDYLTPQWNLRYIGNGSPDEPLYTLMKQPVAQQVVTIKLGAKGLIEGIVLRPKRSIQTPLWSGAVMKVISYDGEDDPNKTLEVFFRKSFTTLQAKHGLESYELKIDKLSGSGHFVKIQDDADGICYTIHRLEMVPVDEQ